jgi:hypothetical protein
MKNLTFALLIFAFAGTVHATGSVPACRALGAETLYSENGGWGKADCHPADQTHQFRAVKPFEIEVETETGVKSCIVLKGDNTWMCSAAG